MAPTRMELHWGRVIRCYSERPSTVDGLFRRAASEVCDACAVVDGSARLSYRELELRTDRLAAGLTSRGVARGDRVALLLSNRIEFVISVLAISRIGAIVVPVGTRLRQPEIAYILQDADVCALIYESTFEAELPPSAPAASMRFCVGTSAMGSTSFDKLSAVDAAPARAVVTEDDVFGILYTSGTTGRPKGAMLTHLGAIHSSLHWAECLKLERGEATILCVPWSHVAGLCGVVLPFLHIGGRMVLMSEFRRRAFLELAAAERITHALLVPAMYGLLLLERDLESFDLSTWRLGVYGSAPMPEPTIRRFAKAIPHLVMCNAYGATETTSPATIMPPGEGIAHSDSIGKVVPCGEISVMDEECREVSASTNGELWIAGPMIVPGYWRNEEATAESFKNGFWCSGDIGSVDAAGYVRIADRKKDVINRGGFKVYPAEVENVLCDCPAVDDVAVVGQSDEILGERVIAFVSSRDATASEGTIREFCSARLADYKVPDHVVVQSEPLPRNANGKIQKSELRARADQLPRRKQSQPIGPIVASARVSS
jgi:long-chain acyl-CoA synthetase